MRLKKFFKYPATIYAMYISGFMLSTDFVGVYLRPFFNSWGGLSQFQIQNLQSWFQFVAIPLEIPTGMLGDKHGRKLSVVLGMLCLATGPLIYSIVPNLWLFIIAEAVFALGLAFLSGAEVAVVSDSLAKMGRKIHPESDDEEKEAQFLMWHKQALSTAIVKWGNIRSLGRIVGSLLAPFALFLVSDFNQLFWLWVPFILLAALIIIKWVEPDDDGTQTSRLKPNYRLIFSRSIAELRAKPALRRIMAYIIFASSIGYFVIWLSQMYMEEIGIPYNRWGFYRIFFVGVQIVVASTIQKLNGSPDRSRRNCILIIAVIIVMLLISLLMWNQVGLLAFYVAGAFSLITRLVLSGDLNSHISQKYRATVLSFAGMGAKLSLVILNPIVGFLADLQLPQIETKLGRFGQIQLLWAVLFLIGLMVITIIFLIPKKEDFH